MLGKATAVSGGVCLGWVRLLLYLVVFACVGCECHCIWCYAILYTNSVSDWDHCVFVCRSEMDRSGRRWSVVSAASSGYTTGYTDSPQSLSVSSPSQSICSIFSLYSMIATLYVGEI